MVATDQTVRVFISSTFRDMHAERDHLVTVVFPELRERVEQLGLEFFDVDLRWGVPAKGADGETANSWEYCRKWIDAVEPFFVCMLGQRYGSVPKAEDFKSDEDKARQALEPRSITDLEVRHAVLNDGRKRRSYFYLRETPVPELPREATDEQRKVYDEFVGPPEQLGRLDALKDDIRNCERPVRDYGCRWTGEGFTDLETFGQLVLEDLWSGVLRDDRYVSKEVWQQALGKDPDTDPLYTDESEPIPRELWEKIAALAKPEPKNPLDADRQQMDAFATARLRWFRGRTRELKKLTDFLDSTATDAPRLAVVAAVPGQGKSALLAKLSTLVPQPSTFLIAHFVGATERSASAYELVKRLLGELDRSGIAWPADRLNEGQEPKLGFNSLCLRLVQRLGDYAGERRIVILLDALNQLSDGHDLQWLPSRLGPSVRVVVSCIEDATVKAGSPEERVLRGLDSRQPSPLRVPLGPLDEDDVRVIVVAYLVEYCHELDAEHLATLCAMTQARNPLYLLVMLNELRTLGGNDLNRIVPALIATMPQDHPDTVSLFRWVLRRLEVFGSDAVRWWCLYLVYGRVGMSSRELADLLVRKLGTNAAATALRIERGLRRYLQRRGPQLDFFHSQLRRAVVDQYSPRVEANAIHGEMAAYFTSCAEGSDPTKKWETASARGFSECVFHITKAEQYVLAAGLLSNFVFLRRKTKVGQIDGLLEDYELLRLDAPTEVGHRPDLKSIDSFLHRYADPLRSYGDRDEMFLQCAQLYFEPTAEFDRQIGRLVTMAESVWLRTRVMSKLPSSRESTNTRVTELTGHAGWLNQCVLLSNGKTAVTASRDDHTIRFWDIATGKCARVYQELTYAMTRSHLSGVLARIDGSVQRIELIHGKCAEIPKEDCAVASILEDPPSRYDITPGGTFCAHVTGRVVSVRKPGSSKIEAQVEAEREVVAVAVSEDGGMLAFSEGSIQFDGIDNRITVWDTANHRAVIVIESEFIFGIAKLVAFGLYLVTQTGRWLRVYDTANKTCVFEESFPIAYGLDALFAEGALTILLGCNDSVARCIELRATNLGPLQTMSPIAMPGNASNDVFFELNPTGAFDKVAFATGQSSSTRGVRSYIAHTLYQDGKYKSHYDSHLHLKMFSDGKEHITGEVNRMLGFLTTSNDGEIIVAGDVNGLVHLWKAAFPAKAAMSFQLDIEHPIGAAFLRGDRSILIAGIHGMRVYRFSSFELLSSVKAPSRFGFLTLTVAQDGRTAATANGIEIAIWRVPEFQMLGGAAAFASGRREDGVRFCTFDARGGVLVAASSSGMIHFYNSDNCELLGSRQFDGKCLDLIWCWEYVCALTADGYIHFFDPRTFELAIVYCEKLFMPHCIGRIGPDLCCLGSNGEVVLLKRERLTSL